tara:strand:+ start:382 stop:774 length:393 start_codon:yes stop_codon:yes gene_type:complete
MSTIKEIKTISAEKLIASPLFHFVIGGTFLAGVNILGDYLPLKLLPIAALLSSLPLIDILPIGFVKEGANKLALSGIWYQCVAVLAMLTTFLVLFKTELKAWVAVGCGFASWAVGVTIVFLLEWYFPIKF